MRGINPLRWFKREEKKTEDSAVLVGRTLREQVFNAPAYFNRATRRMVGLTSRLWCWDIPAEDRLPRYVRRHGGVLSEYTPRHKTRRQRKQYARIMRAVERRGIHA